MLVKINPKAGLFFIAFCISYWTAKVFESYYFVLSSYLTLLRFNKTDFRESEIMQAEAKSVRHVVIVPIFTEPYDVIEENVVAIAGNDYPHAENITVLLATESRVPEAEANAAKIIAKFKDSKIEIVNVVPTEFPAKAA